MNKIQQMKSRSAFHVRVLHFKKRILNSDAAKSKITDRKKKSVQLWTEFQTSLISMKFLF